MWSEEGWTRNSVQTLVYSYRKARRESPGITFPSDGRIAFNSRYAFKTCTGWDLRFNPGIFGTESSYWGYAPPILLIPDPKINLKFLPSRDRKEFATWDTVTLSFTLQRRTIDINIINYLLYYVPSLKSHTLYIFFIPITKTETNRNSLLYKYFVFIINYTFTRNMCLFTYI